MLDLLFKDATVVDGTGNPAFTANVGVRDGRVVLPADGPAHRVVEAQGRVLCPGFIDAHSHGDQILGQEQAKLSKVSQGITTEIAGQCGGTMYPVSEEHLGDIQSLVSIGTLTFPPDMGEYTDAKRYFERIEAIPLAANCKILIGHSTLRLAVMGYAERKPTPEEMERMKALVRGAMEQGALGLSSGLIYPPGCYADTDELAELAAVVRPYGGIYATHMRNESDNLVAAVREALEVGHRAGVPVEISHHKACGRQNWGLSGETLALVDAAVAEGMQVTIDQYPYTANMTNLNICIPPQYFDKEGAASMVAALKDPATRQKIREQMTAENPGYDNFYQNAGGFGGILVSGCPETPEADGKIIEDYAKFIGKDPFDAYFDILIANGEKANGIFFTIGEEDVFRIIQHPAACVGTDGSCRTMEEKTHPRAFGSFVRAICWFYKEKGLFTLEEMIQKLTSFPARRLGLPAKGVVADGYDADLLLLDMDALRDNASYETPTALCDGVDLVVVNGVPAYENKRLTGQNPGKILRHSAGPIVP